MAGSEAGGVVVVAAPVVVDERRAVVRVVVIVEELVEGKEGRMSTVERGRGRKRCDETA